MSRKKTAKGKAGSSSPSAGSPTGKGTTTAGKAARSSPGIVQMNGVVHPSRPSISNSSEFYDIAFKVMLVGDSGVGKTCLLVRFKDGAFLAGSFISTVGIDFRNKVLNIDGVKVKLQIWDTAGQERFRSVTHAYYRDAHALLLLYDVTNKSSFDNIQAWLTEIHEYAQQDVVLMLLGNKEFGVPFMETSARSGLNVELAFTAVAKELKHRSMKDPSEKFKLQEYVNKEMKSTSCCRS
ncbi:ras-related protein Rab-26-like isoform X2 [Epinephelus moara]|uniref:ras-related protein Rab-26-like isoform X2 n=1 Tax=Epinephelus moara TaxID=300413 RepID=UPI00214F2B1E|nr:ras-related protein Rab-26-like isoform X2 [Epinephelus moara]